jgi:hypothetical protein
LGRGGGALPDARGARSAGSRRAASSGLYEKGFNKRQILTPLVEIDKTTENFPKNLLHQLRIRFLIRAIRDFFQIWLGYPTNKLSKV